MISTEWKCVLLWQISMLGGVFEQEGAGKKKRGVGSGFQEVYVTYNTKIHSICEIEDLVETYLCNIVCDTPIARITHICKFSNTRIIHLNLS